MFLKSKRFWKRLGIGFAIFVGVLLVANGIAAWWAHARLESRLAKLRASGEPTTIAELAPKPIPPEEDAAAYLESIRDEVEAFHKDYSAFYNTPLGKEWEKRQEKDLLPTPEQAAAMREIVDRFPTILPTLEQAAACEQYASKLDFTLNSQAFMRELLDYGTDFRAVARFMAWHVLVLVSEDSFDAAANTGIGALRLARHYDSEPTMVLGLIGSAVRSVAIDGLNRTLRVGTISDEMRALLEQELNRYENPERIVQVLKTERPVGLASLSAPLECNAITCGPSNYRHHPMAWIVKIWQAGILDGWEEVMPLLEKERHERADHLNQLFESPPSYSTSGTMMHLLSPALVSGVTADNRSTALIRSLRILNALQAYQETHGHEASGLEDLNLPESATIDPFDGKPLKLKWTDEGWVIYSVYQNRKDDGGDFTEMADVGIGPIGYTGPE